MEISEEKFAQLIKKAISINNMITQQLADEFKVTVGTLERWSIGQSLPPVESRSIILQRTTGVMIGTLGNIMNELK